MDVSVANLPAEIAHLLEEIQAKDKLMQECRSAFLERDNILQKFIRTHGSLVVNTKEEELSKAIVADYEKAKVLQDEKLALAEKAAILVSVYPPAEYE